MSGIFLSNLKGGHLSFLTFLTNVGPFEKIVDLSVRRVAPRSRYLTKHPKKV